MKIDIFILKKNQASARKTHLKLVYFKKILLKLIFMLTEGSAENLHHGFHATHQQLHRTPSLPRTRRSGIPVKTQETGSVTVRNSPSPSFQPFKIGCLSLFFSPFPSSLLLPLKNAEINSLSIVHFFYFSIDFKKPAKIDFDH